MKRNKYVQCKDFYPLLKHPEKYAGTPPITIRSSWERKFAQYRLDLNDEVVNWSSEEVVIPYYFGTRMRRYYVDFWFMLKSGKEFLVEIKPHNQTIPPKGKRKTKVLLEKQKTFAKNVAKWEATDDFIKDCHDAGRRIEFVIITEKEDPLFRKTFI